MTAVYGPRPVKRRRRSATELAAVDAAIVAAVEAEHPVTLRGVFYRVVSAGAVEKTELAYRLVMRELLKLRRAGVVPYGHITDGTRWLREPVTWTDLDEMLDDAAVSYRRALWHSQPARVYLLSEKDAISGVIEPVTRRWDVPLGVLRGYASETFAHTMAAHILGNARAGKHTFVYQLGDHDPSGLDAWRDFVDKTRGFCGHDLGPDDPLAVFRRLAVTPVQVTEWDLPTRPTKTADPRAREFAGGSVEVDAVPASTLRRLVEGAITALIDQEKRRLTRIAEQSERQVLTRMVGGAP